jgi:elongation factor Ts
MQALVGELGMIIASSPDVLCVSPEEVPSEVLAKERDVEMGREDLKSKPEAVRCVRWVGGWETGWAVDT